MTEKQEQILFAGLKLFAQNGYAATSTAKVAKEAGVSEGLIFRHFGNKEGLLAAVLEQGQEKVNQVFQSLQQSDNPRKRIQLVIDLAFEVPEVEHDFWRLLYALKWQTELYDDKASAGLKTLLQDAFAAMHYEDPAAEAELVLILLDGLVTAILLRQPQELKRVQLLLHRRYML